jgi:DNA-binding response OmpR family regulator
MILVVDDYSDACDALKKLLQRTGYRTQCANDAAEAMEKMHRETPRLVILDESMPDRSGMDVFKEMRGELELADVPVMFFSGAETSKAEALKMGAIGWFIKGRANWTELLACVLAKAGEPDGIPA